MAFDFESRMASLDPASRNVLPDMPIGTAIREARGLFDFVTNGRYEKYSALPRFDMELVDGLPVLVGKLDEAEAQWQTLKIRTQQATLRPVREEGESFRSDMLAAARFLLREDEEAMALVDRIAEGSGIDDLTLDLNNLARVAEQHADLFATAEDLPKDLPAYARSLSTKLSALQESPESRAAIEHRNQVFFLLDFAVDEIRAAGRYLYRKDPKTLALLASAYVKKKNRRRRQEKPSVEKSEQKE